MIAKGIILFRVQHFQQSSRRVSPKIHGHLVNLIGEGMDQYGKIQAGEADRIGHAPLIAKVGQGHQDPVDLPGVGFEESRAFLGILVTLHRAVGRIRRGEGNHVYPQIRQDFQYPFPPILTKLRGEKPPVPHDQS